MNDIAKAKNLAKHPYLVREGEVTDAELARLLRVLIAQAEAAK